MRFCLTYMPLNFRFVTKSSSNVLGLQHYFWLKVFWSCRYLSTMTPTVTCWMLLLILTTWSLGLENRATRKGRFVRHSTKRVLGIKYITALNKHKLKWLNCLWAKWLGECSRRLSTVLYAGYANLRETLYRRKLGS